MTTTQNKNLTQPANNSSNWDVPLNLDFSSIDMALGSVQPINLTSYAGGTITLTNNTANPPVTSPLTSLSYIPMILSLTGTPVGATTIAIPSTVCGQWVVRNACGIGSYSDITFVSGGAGTNLIVPQGQTRSIVSDGTNIIFADTQVQTPLIPSGTLMLFVQSAAPTGWVKQTTYNDYALRIVSGTAASGGGVAFSAAFTSQVVNGTVGSTVLDITQIPSHSHATATFITANTGSNPGFANGGLYYPTGSSSGTSSAGGGLGHNHPFTGTPINLAVNYVDAIICQKS